MRVDFSHNAHARAFDSLAFAEIKQMLRANIGRHDNQRVTEIDRSALAIG